MKKRIFSIFMVFTLCFVSVDQVYADAGSIIVAGGSVAGITAGAIAGPAVVAVFCAMMAFGMNVELTEASKEAGMTKTQFLKNKIQQYCNEAQISANTFNSYILDQANVFQNGAISLTDKAGALIERFCNWLFDTESVISPSTGISSSVVLNGLTCPVVQPHGEYTFGNTQYGSIYTIYNEGSKPLAICPFKYYNTRLRYEVLDIWGYTMDSSTFDNFSITTTENGASNTNTATTYNMEYNGVYGVALLGVRYSGVQSLDLPFYDAYTSNDVFDVAQHFMQGITDIDLGASAVSTDSITGSMDDYDLSKGVLNPTDNQTIIINPNVTIPVPVDKDVIIDVNEYLEKVRELIDGATDDLITAIDDSTGVPISIEFDPTQDWDPTIEREDDTDLPVEDDRTPVVPDELIPVDYDLEPLKFDLKGFFPFCIPWDIKDMLSKLNASPVAPSYTVNWHIPIVNETLTFTIDLSPYDGVADTLRKMEVLAFCIGLALITRQMILRG